MENVCLHQDVVQMARTPGWGSGGREFESRHPEENEGSVPTHRDKKGSEKFRQ